MTSASGFQSKAGGGLWISASRSCCYDAFLIAAAVVILRHSFVSLWFVGLKSVKRNVWRKRKKGKRRGRGEEGVRQDIRGLVGMYGLVFIDSPG